MKVNRKQPVNTGIHQPNDWWSTFKTTHSHIFPRLSSFLCICLLYFLLTKRLQKTWKTNFFPFQPSCMINLLRLCFVDRPGAEHRHSNRRCDRRHVKREDLCEYHRDRLYYSARYTQHLCVCGFWWCSRCSVSDFKKMIAEIFMTPSIMFIIIILLLLFPPFRDYYYH